jgi:hypothetical protein
MKALLWHSAISVRPADWNRDGIHPTLLERAVKDRSALGAAPDGAVGLGVFDEVRIGKGQGPIRKFIDRSR